MNTRLSDSLSKPYTVFKLCVTTFRKNKTYCRAVLEPFWILQVSLTHQCQKNMVYKSIADKWCCFLFFFFIFFLQKVCRGTSFEEEEGGAYSWDVTDYLWVFLVPPPPRGTLDGLTPHELDCTKTIHKRGEFCLSTHVFIFKLLFFFFLQILLLYNHYFSYLMSCTDLAY